MQEYRIDAANQILGRVASRAAFMVRGKASPSFDPSRIPAIRVIITNTDKLRVTGKKMRQKIYRRHSGYHGGLKEETLEHVIERDSRLAMRRAITGMLPKNRLRARLLRHVILYKGDA